jgi:hypothetical protein
MFIELHFMHPAVFQYNHNTTNNKKIKTPSIFATCLRYTAIIRPNQLSFTSRTNQTIICERRHQLIVSYIFYKLCIINYQSLNYNLKKKLIYYFNIISDFIFSTTSTIRASYTIYISFCIKQSILSTG